ncbi:MAG: glycosyltransferase family 87 protein [Chthoniobacter sp.]
MKNKPERLVLLVALLALAAKIYCAATTLGTTDMLLFQGFGRYIAQEGVVNMYLKTRLFNHPPLLGNYIGLASEWSGGNNRLFAFYNRLPGIFADFAVVLVVLWIRRRTGGPPWWALLLLAASPVSFMISGYHGNYDSLIPLGLVLTVAACLQNRAMLAGVLLGLACQVKIIPLVMAPVLFFFWLHRGQGARFVAATVVTLLAGWSAPLVIIPQTFVHQVLVYNSIWGWWGITYLLNISGLHELQGIVLFNPLTLPQTLVVYTLKALVILGALIIAWRRRQGPPQEMLRTMGIIWAVFFTFAPGFGVQYLAWVSPFLLFYSARWFAAFTAAASVALFIFYNTISQGMPWFMGYRLEQTSGTWAPWMLLPWIVFAALAITARQEMFGLSRTAATAEGLELQRPAEHADEKEGKAFSSAPLSHSSAPSALPFSASGDRSS